MEGIKLLIVSVPFRGSIIQMKIRTHWKRVLPVSVPFRGSFIQIQAQDVTANANVFPSPSGDPLFKSINDLYNKLPVRVSVPFRGSFIQMIKEEWQSKAKAAFPSPSGDPLFKCAAGFTYATINGFPSPSGDPLFK